MSAGSPNHLRIVNENFIPHEDQLWFLSYVARDEEAPDVVVWGVFKNTLVTSREELDQAFAILQEERPAMLEKLNEVFVSKNE